jgi:hypothetical protein
MLDMCKSVFPSPLKQFRDLSSPYLPLHSTYWSPFDSKVMLYVTLLSATLVWCGSLLTVKGCSTQYIHVRMYICLHSCAMCYGSYVCVQLVPWSQYRALYRAQPQYRAPYRAQPQCRAPYRAQPQYRAPYRAQPQYKAMYRATMGGSGQ